MLIRTLAVLTLGVAVAASGASNLNYPQTKKVDQKDTYHGTVVEDPYRWLETDVRESKDVEEWVRAENKVSFGCRTGGGYQLANGYWLCRRTSRRSRRKVFCRQ